MSDQRIKGQEVSILITRGGQLEDTLTAIQNFNFEPKSEIKEEGYLGEKTPRMDDVYMGCRGDLEMHTQTQDWLLFMMAVHDRQKRNTPDLVINISAVLFYPNGQTPTLMARDCKFGNFPTNVGSRTDYKKVKLDWASSDYEVQF